MNQQSNQSKDDISARFERMRAFHFVDPCAKKGRGIVRSLSMSKQWALTASRGKMQEVLLSAWFGEGKANRQ